MAVAALAAAAHAETLGDAFRLRRITPPAGLSPDIERPVLQSAVLEDPDDLVAVAVLAQPIRWLAVRLERASGRWRAEPLRWDAARTLPAGAEAGLDACGTPMDIVRSAGGFRVDTHVTPSAACTIFLSQGLGVRAVLYGWPVAELSPGRFVYQRSQIHFAASHPLELRLFDAQRLSDALLHPAAPVQPVRAGFVASLSSTFRPEWCRPRNHPCDPQHPGERLAGDLVASPAGDALAFLSTLEEDTVPPVQAVYVYRGLAPGQRVEFRELSVGEFRARFGTLDLRRALEPEGLDRAFAR